MAAGESARAEVERVRKKISDLERYADTFERGAIGEECTAEALSGLDPDWVVFHDLRWPGRRLANIDHVVVGPGGVFVIDSKNWSGNVTVKDGVLRQNGYNREKNVASVADAGLALASLLGPHASHVHPVLCFVQQCGMRSRAHEVLICSTDNVVDLLMSFGPVWTPQQVIATATRLDGQVIAATQAGRGYAPGAEAWAEVPRASSGRPTTRSHPSHAGSPQPVPSGHLGRDRRTARAVVAAGVAILLGLPMLLGVGAMVAGGLAGATSSEAECSAAAAAAERQPAQAAERPKTKRPAAKRPAVEGASGGKQSGATDC